MLSVRVIVLVEVGERPHRVKDLRADVIRKGSYAATHTDATSA